MKRDLYSITFKDLEEIECLIEVMEKYLEQNPNESNYVEETLEKFRRSLCAIECIL